MLSNNCKNKDEGHEFCWSNECACPCHTKPIAEIATQGEARDIARDWQNWQAEQSLSYGELAEYQEYFTQLADKFGLTEEFKENGII